MEVQNKPVTEVIIKHKENQSILEFANMLETIAKKLKEEQKFTFIQGNEEIEIAPSQNVKVEIEYEVKGDKHSFELELDWYPAKEEQSVKIKE